MPTTADFQRLLLTDTIFMNGRMAKFYGVDLPDGAPFQEVKFEPDKRAGIISHPFILSGFAYMQTSSPIHRGVFMSRGILGRGVKPPPIAVAPTAPDLAAGSDDARTCDDSDKSRSVRELSWSDQFAGLRAGKL